MRTCVRVHNKLRMWRSNVSQYVSTSLGEVLRFISFPSFSLNSRPLLLLVFFSISFVSQTEKVHVYLITVSFECSKQAKKHCMYSVDLVVVAAAFVTSIFFHSSLKSHIQLSYECTYVCKHV